MDLSCPGLDEDEERCTGEPGLDGCVEAGRLRGDADLHGFSLPLYGCQADSVIAPTGHSSMQVPHSVQSAISMRAHPPSKVMAPAGQAAMQASQPVQSPGPMANVMARALPAQCDPQSPVQWSWLQTPVPSTSPPSANARAASAIGPCTPSTTSIPFWQNRSTARTHASCDHSVDTPLGEIYGEEARANGPGWRSPPPRRPCCSQCCTLHMPRSDRNVRRPRRLPLQSLPSYFHALRNRPSPTPRLQPRGTPPRPSPYSGAGTGSSGLRSAW